VNAAALLRTSARAGGRIEFEELVLVCVFLWYYFFYNTPRRLVWKQRIPDWGLLALIDVSFVLEQAETIRRVSVPHRGRGHDDANSTLLFFFLFFDALITDVQRGAIA